MERKPPQLSLKSIARKRPHVQCDAPKWTCAALNSGRSFHHRVYSGHDRLICSLYPPSRFRLAAGCARRPIRRVVRAHRRTDGHAASVARAPGNTDPYPRSRPLAEDREFPRARRGCSARAVDDAHRFDHAARHRSRYAAGRRAERTPRPVGRHPWLGP